MPAKSDKSSEADDSDEPEVDPLLACQVEQASSSRQALVEQWREVSKPRRQPTMAPQPRGAKLDFPLLFQEWLEARDLGDALEQVENQRGWLVYRYKREPIVKSEAHWELAFHGTWWYPVWLLLESGILLESNDLRLGHDFWEPGVYCSPLLETARWYARPHILFGDGVFHRVVLELRVDTERRKRNRQRGGIQWVFNSDAVSIHGVWVQVNAPPVKGEERVNEWDPALEALPPGKSILPATVNTREGPWPEVEEDEDDKEVWFAPHLGAYHTSAPAAASSAASPAAAAARAEKARHMADAWRAEKKDKNWRSWKRPWRRKQKPIEQEKDDSETEEEEGGQLGARYSPQAKAVPMRGSICRQVKADASANLDQPDSAKGTAKTDAVQVGKLAVGDRVCLSAKGRDVPVEYDWSNDALRPGEFGEVVEVGTSLKIRGPRGEADEYEVEDLDKVETPVVGDWVCLNAAGRDVEEGYDWSNDVLRPGERGEVLEVGEDYLKIRGPRGKEDDYMAEHVDKVKKIVVGDWVRLNAAGLDMETESDWNSDVLKPGERGEVIEADGDFLKIRGPRGKEGDYLAENVDKVPVERVDTKKKTSDAEGTSAEHIAEEREQNTNDAEGTSAENTAEERDPFVFVKPGAKFAAKPPQQTVFVKPSAKCSAKPPQETAVAKSGHTPMVIKPPGLIIKPPEKTESTPVVIKPPGLVIKPPEKTESTPVVIKPPAKTESTPVVIKPPAKNIKPASQSANGNGSVKHKIEQTRMELMLQEIANKKRKLEEEATAVKDRIFPQNQPTQPAPPEEATAVQAGIIPQNRPTQPAPPEASGNGEVTHMLKPLQTQEMLQLIADKKRKLQEASANVGTASLPGSEEAVAPFIEGDRVSVLEEFQDFKSRWLRKGWQGIVRGVDKAAYIEIDGLQGLSLSAVVLPLHFDKLKKVQELEKAKTATNGDSGKKPAKERLIAGMLKELSSM